MLCLRVPVRVSIHNKLPFSVSLCELEGAWFRHETKKKLMIDFSEELTVKICDLRSAIFPLKLADKHLIRKLTPVLIAFKYINIYII